MTFEHWMALASLGVTLGGGFGAWMYRIDRSLTRITTQLEGIEKSHVANEKEHDALRERIRELSDKLDLLVQRITKLETKLEAMERTEV